MNDIEARLRDMYDAVTSTLQDDDVPGLYERPRRTRSWFAPFAPLAAAAAVIAVIAVVLGASALVRSSAPSPPATRVGTSTSLPPFLIVWNASPGQSSPHVPVVVMSARTGRIIAQVPGPPGGGTWFAAIPTGSPTRFVLATQKPGDCIGTGLDTLTLSASGRPVAVTPWSRPAEHIEMNPAAASADGGTIAFTGFSCGGLPLTELVGVIRDGVVKTWQVPRPEYAYSLSLTADGSQLSFVLDPRGRGTAQVRELDTAAAAGTVAAASRVIYSYRPGTHLPLAVIGADGSTLYVSGISGDGAASTQTGMLTGYRIGGGPLFSWSLRGLRTVQDLSWVGDTLFAQVMQGWYLIDPVTGHATRYRKLPPYVGVGQFGW